MKSLPVWHHQHLSISVFVLLVFMLAACSLPGTAGTTQRVAHGTATTSTGTTATVSSTPVIKLGSQPCPEAVKDPKHWDPIVGTQAGTSKVESVTCATLIGIPKLQALIMVRNQGTGAILDVYVYNNITDPSPQQLFKLQGLTKGDAKISGYNTLLTAEVDPNSSINKNQPNASLTLDLFREFKWSDGAGTLVPISFVGIFPDLTRYQAETDQAQVNQGHQPWKLDPGLTANALAVNLLKWSANAQTTVISGGTSHDTNAVVQVKSTNPGGSTIKVTLGRLEGNTNGGIWEATGVTADGMSITTPQNQDRLTSPTTVSGTGNAFEGKIGTVMVLDHLYNDIGHADAKGAIGNGNTSFNTPVTYTSTFKGGAQEGVVALYTFSNADGSIAAAVMVKELLS
jgi:Immunoglobulin-like domain of bacterial spore germination